MLVAYDGEDDVSSSVFLKAVVVGAASGAGVMGGHSRLQIGSAAVQQAVQEACPAPLPTPVPCRQLMLQLSLKQTVLKHNLESNRRQMLHRQSALHQALQRPCLGLVRCVCPRPTGGNCVICA